MIIKARVLESEAPSIEPPTDTVMGDLFATSRILPPPRRENFKRRKHEEVDETTAQKNERREMEAARRAWLTDEGVRQIRALGSAAGASSSRDEETA